MNTSKTKKGLSVLLAIIMVFSMISTAFSVTGVESCPVMKAYSYVPVNNLPDYHAYRESIVTATFLDEIDTTGAYMVWDISASAETGTVKAWIKGSSAEAGKYDLYIGGEGGVAANTLSSNVFYNFVNLKEVIGLENFKTGNATTLDCMFENCASLTTLDLSSFDTTNVTNLSYLLSGCTSLESVNFANWDTSKATNMGFMFNNCVTLPVLDLSGFNTKKVTNMMKMFYRCEKLTTLYTGDKWSVEQVTNHQQMFNCCYIIEGEKSFSEVPSPYDKQYANYEGFLTYKAPAPTEYTVSYEIIGNVGPKDNVPETFKYNAGSLVSVEDALKAEGYIFSGWTTEDAEVEDGKFTINNNVHFVGSWSKLYKVTYVYDNKYSVPENAPALPDEEAYTANTSVAVKDIPFVEGYTFVGWDTEDADVTADGKFLMPEKDVVLYGFFKKPVEGLVVNGNVHDINLNMIDNKETVINVVVTPPDATIQNVTFTSSNPEVAEVDENGKITAKSEGTTTITIKTTDGSEIQVDINVTVKNPVTDITVDKKDVELYVGETDKITGTVNESATNKNVIYESTDSTIAEVDKDGNIIAKGEGTTTIIVKSEDDETIVETVTVTVKNPVTEITAPENITLYIDEIKNIDAKVNDATYRIS